MKINLGSGVRLFPGYTNVDLLDEKHVKHAKGSKYVQADIRDLPFKDNTVDQAEMYSVIEHFPFRDVVDVLKEVYRVLKPEGKLIIKTDDFDGLAMDWIRMRMEPVNMEKYQNVMETVYGNQQHEGEFHKVCMTTDFLNWALVKAGFKKGTMTKLPKHSPCRRVGGMFPIKKDRVYRNDQILVEAEK
jgi:predicted SAM-dependent methyltransferase